MTTVKGRHRHLDAPQPSIVRAGTPAARPGPSADVRALLAQFPARPLATTWPVTEQPRDQVLQRLFAPPFVADSPTSQDARRRGLRRLLDWLADFPGRTWQDRWQASGAEELGNAGWRDLPVSWIRSQGIGFADASYLHRRRAAALDLRRCDPPLRDLADRPGRYPLPVLGDGPRPRPRGVRRVERVVRGRAATVRDETQRQHQVRDPGPDRHDHGSQGRDRPRRQRRGLHCRRSTCPRTAWATDTPATACAFTSSCTPWDPSRRRPPRRCGCSAPEDSCPSNSSSIGTTSPAVRDLLVDYRERQGLDHGTLRNLTYQLGLPSARPRHHPGISDLRLTPQIALAWKQRVAVRTTSTGTRQRAGALNCMTVVRAFYLDIAHWAMEDPVRGVPGGARVRSGSRRPLTTKVTLPAQVANGSTDPRTTPGPARLDSSRRQRIAATSANAGGSPSRDGRRPRRNVHRRRTMRLRAGGDEPAKPRRCPRLGRGSGHRATPRSRPRGTSRILGMGIVEVLRSTGIRIEELTEIRHTTASFSTGCRRPRTDSTAADHPIEDRH